MNENHTVTAYYSSWWKMLCWVCLVVLNVLAWISTNKGEMFCGMHSYVFIVPLSFFLTVPLMLEFYFTEIRIENSTIHTRSPWRRRRSIPLSSVTSCDFSNSGSIYRIKTDNYGVVRMHTMLTGLPFILWHMPCKIPRWPIQFFDEDGNWIHPHEANLEDDDEQGELSG